MKDVGKSKVWRSFLGVLLTFAMVVSTALPALHADASDAEQTPRAAVQDYEIYPNPHSVAYAEGDMTVSQQVGITAPQGVDQYTLERLNETLEVLGVTGTQGSAAGKTNIILGIYSEQNAADYNLDAALFEKTDAYVLDIRDDEIIVIGKNTDAVFYGITTLKRIFQQVENRQVRKLLIEDYSDIANRGFIEGYYGNPWSVEDRIQLMKFGGELKMNQYIFAPKDDPYHNSKWRTLYPEEELKDIERMAQAGNENKCYFIWTIHCFMNSPFRFDTEEHYQADFQVITAKFSQLLKAGVRQIGVLGDDAGSINPENALKLLEDLDEWLAEQQKIYPELRRDLLYCPANYYNSGTHNELKTLNTGNDNIQIMATGGAIWGQLTPTFGRTWSANVTTDGHPGRRPYMWVNWPCTDNSKNHLIMGGQNQFLQPGTDGSQYAGIVLNPMQQSEPSKVGIFANADFSWNCWDNAEEGNQNWYDSFKYIESMSPEETAESAALREMSKHMINQAMDSRVVKLEESVELAPKLTEFLEKLKNAELTAADMDEMIREFRILNDAAKLYLESGDSNMVNQITPFISSMRDVSNTVMELLEAMKADLTEDADEVWTHFSNAQGAYEQSSSYGYDYRGETKYAEVGNQHILPFTEQLMKAVSDRVKFYLNPDSQKLEETVILSVGGNSSTQGFDISKVTDGNLSTSVEINREQVVGDYVGMTFNLPVYVKELQIDLWKEDAPKNLFYDGVLQYTTDGKTWQDFEDELQPEGTELHTVKVTGIDREIRGFRYQCTDLGGKDRWLVIREIQYNMSDKTSEEIEYYAGTLMRTNSWTVYQGPESNLTDGNDSTFVWYNPGANSNVGEFVGLDLNEVKKVGAVHIVLGGSKDDKWSSYDLQYSADGEEWTTVQSYTGTSANTDTIDTDLGGVDARYVRLVNKQSTTKWIQFSEFAVGPTVLKPANYTNMENCSLTAWYGNDLFRINSAEGITMKPGEYAGLDLVRIHDLKRADIAVSNKEVTVEISANGIEWKASSELANARYVRLVNRTAKDLTFNVEKFEITTNEIGNPELVEATIGMQSGYEGEDARTNGKAGNWFDGKVTTEAKYCDFPRAGQYVLYDLGKTMDLSSVRAIVSSTEVDYPRDAAIEVSMDQENWTRLLTIGDGAANDAADKDTTPQDNGWTFDTTLPNYAYQDAREFGTVQARYLRVLITADYLSRFLKLAEIQLNDGAYSPAYNDPTFEASPVEIRGYQPQSMADGDFSTAFKPDMTGRTEGYVIYRLSENLDVKKINIAQSGNVISNAKVTARVGQEGQESEWVTLGTLDKSLTSLYNPGYDYIYELKLEWQDVSPVIYEIITLNKEQPVDKKGLEKTIAEALDKVQNAASFTISSMRKVQDALKEAQRILNDEAAVQREVLEAQNALRKALGGLERRADLSGLNAQIGKAGELKQSDYTTDSWSTFSAVLNRAKALAANGPECTQAQADQMVKDLSAALAALVKVSVTPPDEPKPVKVSGIKLTAESKILAAGKKVTVKAAVSPSNASNKNLVWSVSNKKFAAVSKNGVVTLKKAGAGKKVTVTASAADGSGKKGKIVIQIRKNAVKKITLKAKTKVVKAGKSLKIKASVTPDKNVNKTLKWTSGNTKYATVSSSGVVKAKKAGKGKMVKITALAMDGSKKKATIKIKIK